MRTAALQPVKPIKSEASGRISPRVREAISAMVWLGLRRKAAAEHAGLAEHTLYQALRKPSVRALYLAELDVLRTSELSRNIHTLVEVRDDKDNKIARIQAVRTLMQMDEPSASGSYRTGIQSAPGLVIVIQGAQPAAVHVGKTVEAADYATMSTGGAPLVREGPDDDGK